MKVLPASEFAHLNLAIPWAVKDLVPAYGISLIYADPKVGKSILSIQLAHALGNGAKQFLGQDVISKRSVCYVQADEPPQEWAHQLKTVGCTEGWSTVTPPPGCLADPAMFNEIKQLVAPFQFVILDALISLFGYPDIRSPQQAGHLLTQLRLLHPGPIWVIHHKRKSSPGIPDQSRQSGAGSFAINAGVSAIYDLSERKIKCYGRVVKKDLTLDRDDRGRWIVRDAILD